MDSKPILIAIGASGAEGLHDIRDLLGLLPATLEAVVLVVLHRPTDKLSNLRGILSRATRLPVAIAKQGEQFRTGTCYVGEPDGHLTLVDARFATLIDDPYNAYRNRTIDALFNSLAEHAGSLTIGVVLSGSLDDGSRGLAAIHAAGGITMVLCENGKPPPGMPQKAVDYDGPINVIGSPALIADEIVRLVSERYDAEHLMSHGGPNAKRACRTATIE